MGPLSNPINHFGRYHYALNNPYRFIDPDGRQVVGDFGQRQEECPGCTLVTRGDGKQMLMASSVAPDAIMTMATREDSLADYATFGSEERVAVATVVAMAADGIAIAADESKFPPLRSVSVGAKVVGAAAKAYIALESSNSAPAQEAAAGAISDVVGGALGDATVTGVQRASATAELVRQVVEPKPPEDEKQR